MNTIHALKTPLLLILLFSAQCFASSLSLDVVPPSQPDTSTMQQVQQHLTNPHFFRYPKVENALQAIDKIIVTTVNTGKIEFLRDTVSVEGIDVVTTSGNTRNPQRTIWQGVSGKDATISCRFSFNADRLSGVIHHPEGMFFIEPATNLAKGAPADIGIFYRLEDTKESKTLCPHTHTSHATGTELSALSKASAFTAVPSCKRFEVAIAADYSMVQALGSVAAVEQRILEIFSVVQSLYLDTRVNFKLEITKLFIEDQDRDTWGSSLDFQQNLQNLIAWSQSPSGFNGDYDVVSLWYYNIGSGAVGYASIGSVCNLNRAGNVVRYFTSSLSKLALDQAHELGHNFGADHTDDQTDIMYPSITGSNDTWSATSVNAFHAYTSRISCYDACNQPPIANFSIISGGGCQARVQFADQTSFDPNAWQWSFGDGTYSDQQNPIHTYKQNGTYTVSLTAKNQLGSHTETKTNLLSISAPQTPVVYEENEILFAQAPAGYEVRWYDSDSSTQPIHRGTSFNPSNYSISSSEIFAEASEPDGPVFTVGPPDSSNGDGGFKNNGTVYMNFSTAAALRFVAFTVYTQSSGTRLFALTDEALETVYFEKTIDLEPGKHEIVVNWDLMAGQDYALVAAQTQNYVTDLYRNRSGVGYPQKAGEISVNSNYYTPIATNTGWYVGYNWKFQEAAQCASARVAFSKGVTSVASRIHANHSPVSVKLSHKNHYEIIGLNPLSTVAIIDLRGKVVARATANADGRAILGNLPQRILIVHSGQQKIVFHGNGTVVPR